ncbi:MAG TPA: hypothetical protein VED40_00710 [Azospirillaceae bacterium]|nr:hypothetical protein [Azospirillaceae bacterium]
MKTPLVHISVPSIYKIETTSIPLPKRMARCTPDMALAILGIAHDLGVAGGKLVLSDLFRSYDMQFQAYMDHISGKKKHFSPPPGGSMHEAGRAFDLDLKALGPVTLAAFWQIAAKHKVRPIIDTPSKGQSEAWHFDCPGSHAEVYDHYKAGRGTNMTAYQAMAASAILSIGERVNRFKGNEKAAFIQSALIRLGETSVGNIDGEIGQKTLRALAAQGIPFNGLDEAVLAVEEKLREIFPEEYAMDLTLSAADEPADLVPA